MKLTTGIFLLVMVVAGTAWGQTPDTTNNTKNNPKATGKQKPASSNAATGAIQSKGPASATPAKSSATSAVKPAPVKTANPVKAVNPAPTNKVAQNSAKSGNAKATPAPKSPMSPKVAVKPVPATGKAAKKTSQPAPNVAVEAQKVPDTAKDVTKDAASKPINLTGRRDPFVSPVVNRSMVGSGCSTGKRCLAVDQIILKGVVKSEGGMIAVVVNAVNKAYFLRENDPVFNGYVVKITGDSIVFRETIQDKLGKPFTREVTKKITTPAV